ncbi:MAG: TlpA disulfide reductase family protein [Woeseiaceae bacterium]|jgi:thiol-disulfide isomerase/thioredoxin|nr:TlpA disulfide reductase family protein [Woeseiaceae bacterium]
MFLISTSAFVVLMAGVLFYAAQISVEAPAPAPLPIEQPQALEVLTHPAFTLPDMAGVDHDFSEWSGKNRILNFWATWCAPCRREIPLLKAFQAEQGGNEFQVIGIAVDYPEPVANYAETAEFNYPILVGQQDAMAIAESSGIEFVGLPFTMFVSSNGELLSSYIGELHQSHLDTIVDVMTRLDRTEITSAEARSVLNQL